MSERLADHRGELVAAVGFCQQHDAVVELAVVDDGVVGIAGGAEHLQTGTDRCHLVGELAPARAARG